MRPVCVEAEMTGPAGAEDGVAEGAGKSQSKDKSKASGRKAAGAVRTPAEAHAFLNSRLNVEKARPGRVPEEAFKLDRMRALLKNLGNPQDSLRLVHVAGSKGKGSVCEMVASCLQGCGYAAGLFTSPHLVDVRERVRINNRLISEREFAQVMNTVGEAVEGLAAKHGEVTYFEVMTAVALVHFVEQAVDVAVIETGLGGRLDSTNVIVPEVAAVASIQLEHTQLLGETIEEIAGEKAGIFKKGAAALTFKQDEAVLSVLRERAKEVGAELEVLGEDIEFTWRFEADERGPHARVSLTTPRLVYEHLAVPLIGEHQALNCGLALAILDKLSERGFVLPETRVANGLAQTPRNGRLELVWDSPRVYVDGAHTPEAVRSLIKAIGASVTYDSMVWVFGCGADKDVDGMLAEVALGADKVIFTQAKGNPRAVEAAELQRRFEAVSPKMTQTAGDVEEAVKTAARAVGQGDLICVTGSFYLAGEAKAFLSQRAKKR